MAEPARDAKARLLRRQNPDVTRKDERRRQCRHPLTKPAVQTTVGSSRDPISGVLVGVSWQTSDIDVKLIRQRVLGGLEGLKGQLLGVRPKLMK